MEIVEKLKNLVVSVRELSVNTGIPTARIYKWFAKKVSPKYADVKKL